MDKNFFWYQIMKWHSNNRRNFAWRKTQKPYFILVAEILLQQTNAEKVEPVYLKIIKEYPEVNELAEANLNKLKEIVKKLGLVYRAENLIKCAKLITDKYNGEVPDERSKLKELPGVGDYTSDAILCYAFNQEAIPIDTNFLRLYTRIDGLESNYSDKSRDKDLTAKIKSYYKFDNYNRIFEFKEYNYAILDFASEVCKARKPRCNVCCLKDRCYYYELH
ncbi:MAG: A/G-specific adenine glycosylase [Bacillota bacterium]